MKNFLPLLKTAKSINQWISYLLLVFLVILVNTGFSQNSWPNCVTCNPTTSEDFTISKVYLGFANTEKLPDNYVCNPDNPDAVYIFAILVPAGGGVQRYSLGIKYTQRTVHYNSLRGDSTVTETPFYNCLYEHAEIPTNTPLNLRQVTWNCGDKIYLKDLCITYSTNQGDPCKCSADANRCSYVSLFQVQAPLIPQILVNKNCGQYTNEVISLSSVTSGGKVPYTYSWDLGAESYSLLSGTLSSNAFSVLYNNAGTKAVVLTVTDSNGLTKSTTININVNKCCDLALTSPAVNQNAECDGNGNHSELQSWLNNHGGATITDALGVTVTWTYTPADPFVALSDGCGATGSVAVTFTATDMCGFSVSTTAVFTIMDTNAPAITSIPADIAVSCTSSIPAPDTGAVVANDNCGGTVNITVASDAISGQTCLGRYLIKRVYTATDACGNSSSATQTITVNDQTAPSIICPANITVSCAGNVPAPDISAVTASDLCGGAVTKAFEGDVISGQTCANRYLVTRTYSATDACGNVSNCTQLITVNDLTAPTITSIPADITVSCTSNVPAPNTGAVIANDNCGGTVNITVASDAISGQTCLGQYQIKRVYTATDACGNSSSATQTITVNDQTAPSIICPADITVSCAGNVPAPDISAVTVSDLCGGAVTKAFDGDVISGQTCANRYLVTRTYSATDACGNVSNCTQLITVNDRTAPTIISIPADITVSCTSSIPAPNTGAVVANDNCGGTVNVTVASDAISGQTCLSRYLIKRVYTATDACGNSSSATQTITVNDQTAPSIICPADITVSCAGNVPAPDISAVTASDLCGGTVTKAFVGDVISGQTCANRYLVTRTYSATDACGNVSNCTQLITVNDLTAPTITCPANLTVQCAGDVPAPDISKVTATDNCAGIVSVNFVGDVITDKTCNNRFTVTRTYSATDLCGNTSNCQQKITVMDTTPPDLVLTTTCIYLTNYGTWAMNSSELQLVIGQTTDNCSDFSKISFTFNPRTLDCNDIGDGKKITVTATDECGNSITDSVYISIKDTIKPVALCQNISRYLDEFGQTFVVPGDINRIYDHSAPEWAVYFNLLNGGSYDNCGISTMDLDKQLFTRANVGVNTVVLSMYDPSNNMSYCTATVTVLDTIKPVLETVPNVLINVPPGVCTTKIEYPTIKSKDGSPLTLEKVTGLGPNGDFPVGVTLETWKATSQGGVSVYISFTVTVNTYNAAPNIGTVDDITVNEDAAKFDIQLTGINYGIDCIAQKVISLDVTNSNASLLTVTKDYTNGAGTGKLTVMLQPNMSGTATVTMTVRDNGGTAGSGTDTTTKTFRITVTPVNDPPTVVPIPDQVIVIPNTLSVNLVTPFKDVEEGDVLTFTVTKSDGSALPSWMTFNPLTGLLTGAPTSANLGWTEVKVTATDKAGASISDIFLVVVTNPEVSTLNVTAVNGANLLTGGFTVKLFAKDGNFFIPVEITPVFNAGTYTFYNLPNGTYLVKAVITDATMNPGLMNTYYESSTSITGAAQVALNTAGTKTIQVKMVGLTLPGGSYKISGIVVYKTGTPDMVGQGNDPVATPAPGIDLVLKQNGVVVANTITGTDGKYAYSDLPAGTYDVFVEVPGFTQNVTQKVTLDAANPLKDKVDFTIWISAGSHVITKIVAVSNEFNTRIYPNPTTGKVNVELNWNGIPQVELMVYNILGVEVFRNQYATKELIQFDLGKNATGIYMVKIRGEGRSVVKKITLDRR